MRITRSGALATTAVAALAVLAQPRPAASQSPCQGGTTAGEGETLVELATRCGVSLPALLAANPGIRDDMDFDLGARFRIPPPGARQPSPQQACGAYYTIRSGDTLAEIAQKCGLTIPLLASANGPLPSPVGLAAGGRLHIPDLPPEAVSDAGTFAAAAADVAAEEAVEEVAEEVAEEAAEAVAAGTVAEGATVEGDVEAAEAGPEDPVDPAVAGPVELVRVEGELAAGEGCPVVRGEEGEAYGLVGGFGGTFSPGDRVVVLGVPTEAGACGATAALEVRILYRPR